MVTGNVGAYYAPNAFTNTTQLFHLRCMTLMHFASKAYFINVLLDRWYFLQNNFEVDKETIHCRAILILQRYRLPLVFCCCFYASIGHAREFAKCLSVQRKHFGSQMLQFINIILASKFNLIQSIHKFRLQTNIYKLNLKLGVFTSSNWLIEYFGILLAVFL